MSFVKFSSQSVINASTTVDNVFFNDYLPYATAEVVRVYLYGLYKANNATSPDNTLESFSKVLNLSQQDIESAFLYWQEEGLVQILNTDPFEVRYLPIKESLRSVKKFNKKKYASFNLQIEEIISRPITPAEFNQYYEVIEAFHIKPEALIMIIKYATNLKGTNVGHKYITTIAKNWAYEGIRTSEQVEYKLAEMEKSDGKVKDILRTLGVRRKATFEEYNLYIKWTKDLGYKFNDIDAIAKTLKKVGGMLRLDNKLMSYYGKKLLTLKEIEDYENQKDFMTNLAYTVTKALGLYYQDLSNIIDTYISMWLNKGYSDQTIITLANYCFKQSIRTLEGMNKIINKFYKLGLVTKESLDEYISDVIKTDNVIKVILEKTGRTRNVNSWDRDFYRTWTYSWQMSEELISYAAELAHGKSNPMKYMNVILSNWHQNKITNIEKAKQQNVVTGNKKTESKFETHSYSSEQINALFDNLDEVDI